MAVKKKVAIKAVTPAPSTKGAKKDIAATATTTAPKKTVSNKLSVASGTSTKVGTPKAAMPAKAVMPAKAATKKATSKEATPIKLTDRQREFLKTISATKEGYTTAKKAEQKTIEALLDRKLIKRGAKDKQSGNYCYLVSKAGEKHLGQSSLSM